MFVCCVVLDIHLPLSRLLLPLPHSAAPSSPLCYFHVHCRCSPSFSHSAASTCFAAAFSPHSAALLLRPWRKSHAYTATQLQLFIKHSKHQSTTGSDRFQLARWAGNKQACCLLVCCSSPAEARSSRQMKRHAAQMDGRRNTPSAMRRSALTQVLLSSLSPALTPLHCHCCSGASGPPG